MKSIEVLLSENPDILCLQEVPHRILPFLEKTNYSLAYTYDLKGDSVDKDIYICTLSKGKLLNKRDIELKSKNTEVSKSLWDILVYRRVYRAAKEYIALGTDIEFKGKVISILNTRLSTVTDIKVRLSQLEKLLTRDNSNNLFVVGDMNLGNSKFLNALTWFLRGFSLESIFMNERLETDSLIKTKGFVNSFSGINTMNVPFYKAQLDHILTLEGIKVVNYEVDDRKLGSDHKVLKMNIDL